MFEELPMNHVFILFLSCLETKALPFVPPRETFLLLSISCPEAKWNINFLTLWPCPQSGAAVLLSALTWLQALLGVCWCHSSPAPGAKPHTLHPRAALQKEFSELPACRL